MSCKGEDSHTHQRFATAELFTHSPRLFFLLCCSCVFARATHAAGPGRDGPRYIYTIVFIQKRHLQEARRKVERRHAEPHELAREVNHFGVAVEDDIG